MALTAGERRALAELEGSERTVPRSTVLIREAAPVRECYLVRHGWLYSSILMPDGTRQILGLHLPGELAGDALLPWGHAPFALTTATEATVHAIDKSALRAVFEREPRLAMLIHALSQVERTVFADRLASLGRTSAVARVAAMIVDAARRLRAAGETLDDGFALPLTQEEIGDLCGLTAVHVNRTIRRLAEEGLIARRGMRVRVIDEDRLARLACYVERRVAIDMGWWPAAVS